MSAHASHYLSLLHRPSMSLLIRLIRSKRLSVGSRGCQSPSARPRPAWTMAATWALRSSPTLKAPQSRLYSRSHYWTERAGEFALIRPEVIPGQRTWSLRNDGVTVDYLYSSNSLGQLQASSMVGRFLAQCTKSAITHPRRPNQLYRPCSCKRSGAGDGTDLTLQTSSRS